MIKRILYLIILFIVFAPTLLLAQEGFSAARSEPTIAEATSSKAAETGSADSGVEPAATSGSSETAPRETGALPDETATSAPSSPKPASSTTPTPSGESNATPTPASEPSSPTPATPPETAASNTESGTIPFKVFAAIAGVLAVAGIGTYALKAKNPAKGEARQGRQNKKEDNEKNQGCFSLRKLMEDKLKELTDVRGKLEGMAKAKVRGGIREAVKGTPAGELLALAEKLEKEYGRLKKLFEDCVIETEKAKKIILVDAVFCFVIEQNGNFEVFKEMHELLETFKNRKVLLTGADDEQFKKWNLDKMPYEVFTLKHNPEKTDPEYFKTLLKNLNVSKNDVIYFEHNPDAVKSAESIGIKSYFYDNKKNNLDALKKFLEENL